MMITDFGEKSPLCFRPTDELRERYSAYKSYYSKELGGKVSDQLTLAKIVQTFLDIFEASQTAD